MSRHSLLFAWSPFSSELCFKSTWPSGSDRATDPHSAHRTARQQLERWAGKESHETSQNFQEVQHQGSVCVIDLAQPPASAIAPVRGSLTPQVHMQSRWVAWPHLICVTLLWQLDLSEPLNHPLSMLEEHTYYIIKPMSFSSTALLTFVSLSQGFSSLYFKCKCWCQTAAGTGTTQPEDNT